MQPHRNYGEQNGGSGGAPAKHSEKCRQYSGVGKGENSGTGNAQGTGGTAGSVL